MHITHSRVQVYPGLESQPAARHASPVQLTPVEWARQTLAFTADPQQSIVLDSAHRRVLVNCCRQWGKSTTAAVRALHHAVHNPSSETILIAPTQRQSAELLRKIKNFSQSLLNTTIKSDGTNRHAIQFTNRARILALPGKRDNIRGFSRVSLLIIDEAAWVPDTLYFAVRPFLAASPNASIPQYQPPSHVHSQRRLRLLPLNLGQPKPLAAHHRPSHGLPPHQRQLPRRRIAGSCILA